MEIVSLRPSLWILAFFVAATLFTFSGCQQQTPGANRPRGASTVTITSNGRPVAGVMVNIEDLKSGEAGGGMTNARGEAHLTNVVRGSYQVTVRPPRGEPSFNTEFVEGDTAKDEDIFAKLIPQRYRQLNTTPFALEVGETPSDFQFDLQEELQEVE